MQEQALAHLRCPICRAPLRLEGKSLYCPQRHCFDVARQGYVHLAPGRSEAFYTRALFDSRARVFASGLFDPVVRALSQALEAFVPGACPVVLDAGCGEGFYLRSVCPDRPMVRMGFDLNRDAVRLAARAGRDCTCFVADLAHIPLADGCCDAVLDVFTPANYAEFRRVLRPGGVLLKLAPRADYLRELREAARDHLRHATYDGEQVAQHAQAHMRMLAQQAITYTLPVTPEVLADAARMTPMLAGIDPSALDLSGITSLTVDETLFVGTLP